MLPIEKRVHCQIPFVLDAPNQFWSFLEKLLAGFVLFAASWTIFVHLCIATERSFSFLLHLVPVPFVIAISCFWQWLRLQRVAGKAIYARSKEVESPPVHWGWFVGAVGIVLLFTIYQQYEVFWVLSIAYLITACLIHWRSSNLLEVNGKTSWQAIGGVIGLCLIAAIVTAIANRPNIDDSFYLSIPAALLDSPNDPMLQHDTMHGLPSLPLLLPVYRLHSLEIFWAVAAQFTGIAPIAIAHFWLPPLFSILSVLAEAMVLRLLQPKHWLLTLAVLIGLLIVMGEAERSYANFAFVRMFQGKSVLVTLMVPLLFLYAWSFGRTGRLSDWILLLATQTASLGITSTALYVAPLASVFALAGTWQPTLRSSKRFILGTLASIYLVIAAFIIRQQMPDSEVLTQFSYGNITDNLFLVLGKFTAYPQLLALLASWIVLKQSNQKWLLLLPLVLLIMPFNPWLSQGISANVTSAATYWRILWAVPLPLMLAVLIVGSVAAVCDRVTRQFYPLIFPVILSLLILLALPGTTLSQQNGTKLGMPGLKVEPDEYATAQSANQITPAGTTVLATEQVAPWLATTPGHPKPLVVRELYLNLLQPDLGQAETQQRLALLSYVSGKSNHENDRQLLVHSINQRCIGTIIIAADSPSQQNIANLLIPQKFDLVQNNKYQIWTRPKPECAVSQTK
jgi:hypothetical protein